MSTFLLVMLWTAAVACIGVGLVGIVMPALPGPALVYAGIVLAAWAHGFDRIGIVTLVVLGLVTLLLLGVDYVSSAVGTKQFGGSGWGVAGAAIGAIVGLFFMPIGILLGPLVGAILGELIAGKDKGAAAKAGFGAFLGFLAGTVVKYLVCFGMLLVAGIDLFF
ncbi:MAG: DUF456 family protein [Acidobacteriota bacterium]